MQRSGSPAPPSDGSGVSMEGEEEEEVDGQTARPPIIGARAKSFSVPGARVGSPHRAKSVSAPGPRIGSPPRQSGSVPNSPQKEAQASAPKTVREYRDALVELYKKYAPAKKARVDYLLEKYKGNEEFLYRTVCAKYQKIPGDSRPPPLQLPPAKSSGSVEDKLSGAKAAAKAGQPKSVKTALPGKLPPGRASVMSHAAKGVATKQNGVAAGANSNAGGVINAVQVGAGELPANGKTTGAGSATRLLADIDLLLVGENTGFFDVPMGDSSGSGGSGSESGSVSGSEGSSSEDEDAARSRKAPHIGDAGAPKAVPPPLSSRPKEALPPKAAVAKPEKARRPSPKADGAAAQAKSGATGVIPKPPPLRKAPPPALPVAQPAASPVSSGDVDGATGVVHMGEDLQHLDEAEDSDSGDEDLAAALAARLGKNEEESCKVGSPAKLAKPDEVLAPVVAKAKAEPPPPPLATRPDRIKLRDPLDDSEEDAAENNAHGSTAPAARPKKEGAPPPLPGSSAASPGSPAGKTGKAGWGAPPPLRAKAGNNGEQKPKAASAPVVLKEPPAPPLFDQWLAVLKFLTGWNDQRSYTIREIKDALCEHLGEEGIANSGTIQRLCSTIVPLLSDLRRTDASVMKNVKKDMLRSLKIIQIYILRIVTFELIRERDAKATASNDGVKKKSKEAKEGDAYLAGDISSLAKTVQHFRFESGFSGGLQKLITSIKTSKPKAPKGVKVEPKDEASTKKQPEAVPGDTSGTKRKSGDALADDDDDEVDDTAADSTRDKGSAPPARSTADSVDKSDAPQLPKRQRKTV